MCQSLPLRFSLPPNMSFLPRSRSNPGLLMWPGLRFPNHVVAAPDGTVWVSDGTNARLLHYDQTGKLLNFWGTYGVYPGAFWELHQFSVDSEGNLYTADSFGGRSQKYKPKAGADTSRLVPASTSLPARSN